MSTGDIVFAVLGVMGYIVGCAIAASLMEDAPNDWKKVTFIVCWPVIAAFILIVAFFAAL